MIYQLGSGRLILAGGTENVVTDSKNIIPPPSYAWKEINPFQHIKNISLPTLIFYIAEVNCFTYENNLFIAFIKNVWQWGIKKYTLPLPSGSEKNHPSPSHQYCHLYNVIYIYIWGSGFWVYGFRKGQSLVWNRLNIICNKSMHIRLNL